MTAPDKIWTYEGPDGADWSEHDQGGPCYHHQRAVDELLGALHRLAQSIENADLLTDAPNTQKGLMLISAKRDADRLIAKHRDND